MPPFTDMMTALSSNHSIHEKTKNVTDPGTEQSRVTGGIIKAFNTQQKDTVESYFI